MFDVLQNIKLLIDEDLSPAVARNLCEELLIDAVAVRDRGLRECGRSQYFRIGV